jgi:hypothetical protein
VIQAICGPIELVLVAVLVLLLLLAAATTCEDLSSWAATSLRAWKKASALAQGNFQKFRDNNLWKIIPFCLAFFILNFVPRPPGMGRRARSSGTSNKVNFSIF